MTEEDALALALAAAAKKNLSRPSLRSRIYENVIGSGAVDTPGERAGELIKGGAAAVTRGFADAAALPGNLVDLGIQGSNWARGKLGLDPINLEEQAIGGRVVNAIPTSKDTRGALSSATGGASDFVAPGRAGQYVSTAGEFAGGAAAMTPLRAAPSLATGVGQVAGDAVRYGVLPGLASEGAGQLTEGTAAEPWARAIAPIAASIALTPRPTTNTLLDERGEAARRLQERGIKVYAGQARDADGVMRVEGTLSPTPAQLNQFTRAALREAGYKGGATRATPGVLRAQQATITGRMNQIVDIDVPITPRLGQEVIRVADSYTGSTPGMKLPVRLQNVATEILDAATNPSGNALKGTQLREWRTALGRFTTSADEAVRDAAHDLREVIDMGTDEALVALGRADDVAELAQLRTQYRNLIAIADATTRGGRLGASGVLTPERVATSSKRVFGRQNYAMDRGTALAELARDAEMIIGAAPTVKPGGVRDVANAMMMAVVGGTAGAQQGGTLATTLAGAAAGAVAPTLAQELMRTGVMQSAMIQPNNIFRGLPAVAPGVLGGR